MHIGLNLLGIDSSFSSHGAEHQDLVFSMLLSPHLLTLLPPRALQPLVLGLFRVFLKLFLKPPTASKPSLARGAELHFSSNPEQILVSGELQRWHGSVWVALCHPSGFISHGWGHLGVSGITAWHWALEQSQTV